MNDTSALLARPSIITPLNEIVYENIDSYITNGPGERPWQIFELTQNQDVTEWIKNPSKIELLQPILGDLALRLRSYTRPFRVLDVGCYGGYVFDYLKMHSSSFQAPFQYTGVDIQPSAVRGALAAHQHDAQAHFETGDVFKLTEQFADRPFDVAVCYRVLHHLPYFPKCLQELCRVVRDFVHTALPIKARSQCMRIKEENTQTGKTTVIYFRHFSPGEIEAAVSSLSVAKHTIAHYANSPYSAVTFEIKQP